MRSLFVTGLFQIVGGMTLFFSGLLLVIMRFDEPYRNRFENPVCGVWTGGVSRSFASEFLNYCDQLLKDESGKMSSGIDLLGQKSEYN